MPDARNSALKVLNELNRGDKTLDGILDGTHWGHNDLSGRDRSLFNALIYGVLRWRGRLDHIIAHFSNSPVKKIQPAVLNILRLGLFQIIYLDRIPDSAAVNTSVELSKQSGASHAAGFVNALLRKAATHYNSVAFPSFENDPVACISAGHSLPAWLTKRWLRRFDKETVVALCGTINSIPPITIRTNSIKTTRDRLLSSLTGAAEEIEATAFAPDGIKMNNPKQPIPDFPEFKNGLFQVQDEAAQLVSLLLNPQPEESVLDACAGLGGKTGHIAQLMQNKGILTAVDKDAQKLKSLDSEMRRLGISIVRTHRHDLNFSFSKLQTPAFDRILLDAPCSGLGVLRRNPDIKWNSSDTRLKRHADIQRQFLENLVAMVKPGGILVYSVCSIEPEENEQVVNAFLKKHPEFVIDRSLGKLPEMIQSLVEPASGFKTVPLLNNMDGFFLTRLKRIK
jgi:16S rRNA (cytosine967-C5)-methyltransferase